MEGGRGLRRGTPHSVLPVPPGLEMRTITVCLLLTWCRFALRRFVWERGKH